MPIRSASATCVSLRWRRSCRIFRPTSSSCAGLVIGRSLTFMLWENKLRFGQSTGFNAPCQVTMRAGVAEMLPEIESSMEALPINAVGRADPRRPTTYKNLHLLAELIRRDFNARFTGSALGLAWALLQPLSLVFLYWFVFTFMIPQPVTAGGQSYVYFLI